MWVSCFVGLHEGGFRGLVGGGAKGLPKRDIQGVFEGGDPVLLHCRHGTFHANHCRSNRFNLRGDQSNLGRHGFNLLPNLINSLR